MTETRIGNKAPDWGRQLGIAELWSEILPGLWMGGTADADTLDVAREWVRTSAGFEIGDAEIGPEDFDAVVTLYAWARPVDWGVEELRTGVMDGAPTAAEVELVLEAVKWAHKRWKAGKKVLVRCQAGMNRSGLVTALVLMKDGLGAEEAIDLIRSRRSPDALFNNHFVRLIHRLEDPRLRELL